MVRAVTDWIPSMESTPGSIEIINTLQQSFRWNELLANFPVLSGILPHFCVLYHVMRRVNELQNVAKFNAQVH